MKIFNKLAAGLVFASLSLISLPSQASHVTGFTFSEQPFTFDATAYGGTLFSTQFIDFSYEAEIDFSQGAFSETGMGFFGTFRNSLGGAPVANTGLGTSYQLYVLFSGTGGAGPNGAGGIDGTFSSFNVSIYIDPGLNTTSNTFTVGTGAGNESKTRTGVTSDDVLILTGTLATGGFHVFNGLAGGDFDVLLNVNSFEASVLGGTAFLGPVVQADINGVNTVITGLGAFPGDIVDARIIGSGNTSLQSTIPEPTSLALLGIGLLGLAMGTRRNKKTA